jgi:hypothetical protein
MQQITIAVNPEEWDRFQRVLPAGRTVYSFAKEIILARILELETMNGPVSPTPLILEMVAALRDRKWSLYQMEDYSDRNHKLWLEARFRKATRTEILDAISLFRTKVSQ